MRPRGSAGRAAAALGSDDSRLAASEQASAGMSVLFHRLVRLLSGETVLALAGGALLATSFGYWYFANGEVHHYGLVVILAICLLVVERRRHPGPAPGFAALMGALNAVAIVFHQDAVLFGFSAVAMLLVDRPWREGVKDAAAYVAGGSVATVVLAAWVGVFIRGLGTPRELFDWYFWPTWSSGVHVYEIGGVLGARSGASRPSSPRSSTARRCSWTWCASPPCGPTGTPGGSRGSPSSPTASWPACSSGSGRPGARSVSASSCRSSGAWCGWSRTSSSSTHGSSQGPRSTTSSRCRRCSCSCSSGRSPPEERWRRPGHDLC